jgi:HEAT repeats
MAIVVTCARCGAVSRVPDEYAGKRGRCKQCGDGLTVPGPTPSSAADEAGSYSLVETVASAPEEPPARPPAFVPPDRSRPAAGVVPLEREATAERGKSRTGLWIGVVGAVFVVLCLIAARILFGAFKAARKAALAAREREIERRAGTKPSGAVFAPAPNANALGNAEPDGGLPPLDGDPQTEAQEKFIREIIAASRQVAETVEPVKTLEEARRVAPEVARLAEFLKGASARAASLPKLTADQNDRLKKKYAAVVDSTQSRARRALERYEALGAAQPGRAPGVGTSPPEPSALANLRNNPNMIVAVVIVSAASDPRTREFVAQELNDLSRAAGSGGSSCSIEYRGNRMYCQLIGVDNPRALAERICFGEVTKVEGKIIEVTARPLSAEKPAPIDFACQLLADLESPIRQRRANALNRLASAPKGENAAQVADALVKLLGEPEPATRRLVVKALMGWGSRDDSVALAKSLDVEPDQNVRRELLKAIETFADPRAARSVAARLGTDPNQAVAALIAMGAGAEDAALAQLMNNASQVRVAACRVLEAIGSRKSIVPLQRLAQRSEAGVDGAQARKALRALGADDGSRTQSRNKGTMTRHPRM